MLRRPSCRLCLQLSACSTPQSLFPSTRRASSSAATASVPRPTNGATDPFIASKVSFGSEALEERDASAIQNTPTPVYIHRREGRSVKQDSADGEVLGKDQQVHKLETHIANGRIKRLSEIRRNVRRDTGPLEQARELELHEVAIETSFATARVSEQANELEPHEVVVETSFETAEYFEDLGDAVPDLMERMRAINRKNEDLSPIAEVWGDAQLLVASVSETKALTHARRLYFRQTLQDVFRRLAEERCQSSEYHLPALARYVIDERIWDDSLFLALLKRPVLACVRALYDDDPNPQGMHLSSLLEEVIAVWAIYLGSHEHRERLSDQRWPAAEPGQARQREVIQPLDDTRLASILDVPLFLPRYTAVFPSAVSYYAPQLGALAVLSRLCLYQMERPGKPLSKNGQSRSFSTLMNQIMVGTSPDFGHIHNQANLSRYITVQKLRKVRLAWNDIHRLANSDSQPSAQALLADEADQSAKRPKLFTSWGRVQFEMQNWGPDDVRRHWRRFLDELDIGATAASLESKGMVAFLWRFVELREYDDVLAVLAEARRRKCKLSTAHYGPVLECHNATDNLDALRSTWAEMQRDGVLPNNAAWSVVLECEMRHGHWKRALEQLEALGAQWQTTARKIAAFQGNYRGAPVRLLLPDMAPVNTVVHGLLARGLAPPVAAVLRWAEQQGLKADRVTHNIILHHFVDQPGWAAAARRHVDMEPADFLAGADLYTLSILTRALFKNRLFGLGRQPHAAQNAAADAFFADLRASGAVAPPHVFTTIIHTLLSAPGRANFNGAHRVLRVMDAEQGVAGTPHLLSLFAKYHLGQGADAAHHVRAVRGLWRRWRERRWPLDAFVYNQVLKGLAAAADPDGRRWPALADMRAWAAERAVPTSYDTLVVLLGLMAREWRVAEASALVRGLREGRERAQETPGLEAEAEFWALVKQLQQDGILHEGESQPQVALVHNSGVRDRDEEDAIDESFG